MDFDRLKDAWQAQDQAQPSLDAPPITSSVMERCRKFDRDVFRRDALEVGTACLLIPAMLVGAHSVGRILWPWYLSVALIAWVAAFFLVDRRQQRKPDPAAPLHAHIEHALRHVEHQLDLLRNIALWYLLPGLLFTILPALEILAETPQCYPAFLTLVMFMAALYPAVYWFNRRTIRKQLIPLKEEFGSALRELGDTDYRTGMEEKKTLINKHPFMFGVLFALVAMALAVVAQLIWSFASGGQQSSSTSALRWTAPEDARKALGHLQAAPPRDLTIVKARYGAGDTWVDVTSALQNKVKNGALSVSAGNNLAGADPVFGKTKTLELEYTADGKTESLSLPEGGFVEIPAFVAPISAPQDLLNFVRQCPAQVGFYGINLTTGKCVEHQPDQPACMASIVKLFTLLEAMNQARSGGLKLTDEVRVRGKAVTVDEALDLMIGQSDNDATEALTARVGYDKVNALPAQLGMSGVSAEILPKPGVLAELLDRRVRGLRSVPSDNLPPQHATARGMARFFELMHEGKLLSLELGADVRARLERHPRGFVPHAPAGANVIGKGGSLSWKRPPNPAYNMIGWDLYVTDGKQSVAFCMWCEWFPEQMPQDQIDKWCFAISDAIAGVLLNTDAAP